MWRRLVGAVASYGVVVLLGAFFLLQLLNPAGSFFLVLRLILGGATLLLAVVVVVLVYHLGWWAAFAPRHELLDALDAEDEEAEVLHPPKSARGTVSARQLVQATDRVDGNRPDTP